MSNEENLHAGHRARVIEKFLQYPDSFCEHEVLEAILFFALPRVDTNPLAHRLIKAFGSLERVVCATEKELTTVDGIGKRTAALLMTFGAVAKRITSENKRSICLSSPESVKNLVGDKFVGQKRESFLFIMMNKNRNHIATLEFTDNHSDDVSMEIPELTNAILIHRPKYAIIAHNHPSGNPTPSDADDLATKKLYLLCSINGINLIDHVIYANGKFFSYYSENRIEYVKQNADVNKLLDNIKEKHYNDK